MLIAIFIFLAGIIFGSFYNALIYRIPRDISIMEKHSICPNCKTDLKALDLFPVFSWLFLRGKCRYCKNPISWHYPFIELLTGFLFLLTYYFFGFNWQLLIYLPFFSMLLITAIIDYQHMIISPLLLIITSVISLIGILLAKQNIFNHFLGAVLGFVIYYVVYFIAKLVYKKEAFGFGDVLLLSAIGFVVGVQNVIVVAFGSAVIASIFLLVFSVIKKKFSSKEEIPFGPYICIAGFIVALYGNSIITWYTSLF